MTANIPRSRTIQTTLLIAVILAVAFLHLYNLGKFGFWGDEMYHVFTAQSLLEKGTPVFPGGMAYRRALPFTYTVAASFKLLGVSEFSARLPSVLFSLTFIVSTSLVIRRLVDGYTAIVYAMIVGLSPYTLQVTRQCRMYAMFTLFFFFSLLLLWWALDRYSKGCLRCPAYRCLNLLRRDRTIIPALAGSAVCLVIALKLHLLAASIVAILPVFCLGMLLHEAWQNGWKTAGASVYSLVLTLCIIGGIGIFIFFDRQRLMEMAINILALPNWATFEHMNSQMTSSFYRYYLQDNFPALFFIYPIAVLWLMKEKPSLGMLSAAGFATVFLAHSYVFPLKQERYIYHAFAFFAIPTAYFIRHLIQESWARMKQLYPDRRMVSRVVLSIAFAGGVYIFFYPWLAQAKTEMVRGRWTSQWKEVAHEYRPLMEKRQLTVITTSQNHFYHYFGRRPDFYLRASYRPGMKDAEFYLASETIYTLEQLKAVLDNREDVILITEFGLGNRDYFTDEMSGLIKERMVNAYPKPGHMKIFVGRAMNGSDNRLLGAHIKRD